MVPGSQDPQGPFSTRDIDVKFRTGELSSAMIAWKEGMSNWLKISEIDSLKSVIQKSAEDHDEIGKKKMEFENIQAEPSPSAKVVGDRKTSVQEEAEGITSKAALDLIRKGSETVNELSSPQKKDGEEDQKENVVLPF